jgi:hypothetical protein
MKIIIIFFPLIIPFVTKSQLQNAPPKKANKIIVLVRDSTNTLLNRLAMALFDRGYTIDMKDEQLKVLSTKELPSKKYGTMSRIRAKINDTAIVLSGQIAINSDRDIFGTKEASKSFYDVEYTGSKKSAMREAWNELEEIARKLSDKIVYSK